MESNGSATGYVQGPISKLTLSLKPGKCSGSPHVNVKLNGQYILDKNLDLDGYQNYEVTNLTRLQLGQKAYPIEIIFNNDSTLNGCSKSVTIDRVSVN
jgi:NAD kinase